MSAAPGPQDTRIDSAYAWARVFASLAIMGVGFAGLYSIVVALKPVAADLGASRGGVSLAYAVLFTGFGFGGIVMGWWSDRIGTMWPALAGSVAIAAGLILAAQATSLWHIVLAFGLLVGFLGMSAIMVPLVANITHWFDRRRGIATSIVISGSYLAGTMWPPLLQIGVEEIGWRETWTRVGIGCFLVMVPLSLLLRPRMVLPSTGGPDGRRRRRALGFTPTSMQCLLCTAGLGCCIAMATPQAHIVAHATDLGHPAARGAEMLSLVFFGGLVSRVVYGWISDRIGGLRTLVLGSLGQAVTIACFIPVEGLVELYVVCALFGLSQGGIVPSYALIVRRYFLAGEAGWRLGWIMLFTMLGMAFGGWLAGILFDLTGTYATAFAAAILFNVANLLIAGLFLLRSRIPVFA